MRRPFACLVLGGSLLAGCGLSPQPVVITAPEPPLIRLAAQPAYAEAVLPMLETMFASFNEQGIEVALPDIPEELTGFAAKVPHGAEAKGAPYETVEKPLAAAHLTLTATGYDCGDSHSTGFSCEVQNWRVVVEDVEAPVVGPDGATIAVAVVRPAPEERSSRRDPFTRLSSRSTPTQRG